MGTRRLEPRPRTPLTIPELDDLAPLPWLPGETPHEMSHEDRPFPAYYTPDGWPLNPVDDLTGWRIVNAYKARPENHHVSRTFYRSGVGFWVSTVYLGLNHNHWTYGPPIIWETMVFWCNGTTGHQWRYATRAAALAGHRAAVATIRNAQRFRRYDHDVTAPRRSRTRTGRHLRLLAMV